MSLILRRLRLLREFTTPFPSAIHLHRLLSTSSPLMPPAKPHFDAADYLIQSCGLSSDQSLRVSKKIDHLKSPDKPDAVLRFLRELGIAEADIRKAVLRCPHILCSSVENNLRPNIEKLKEVGLPMDDIYVIISRCSIAFKSNVVPKIDFWMHSLSSIENVSVVLKRWPSLLSASLDKVLVPNLSFLQEQLGLSVCQIVRLIRMSPFSMTNAPHALTIKVQRAKELGLRCSSKMFVYALALVSNLNQHTIDARVTNLKSLGFSPEEVTSLVSANPTVLYLTEEAMGRKLKFLIKELGFDKLHVIRNTFLLTLSLEKRLIPRNLVWKLLESKGFPVSQKSFVSVAKLTEKKFAGNIVASYEHTIPGLQRAYTEACSGKSSAMEWFKSISN